MFSLQPRRPLSDGSRRLTIVFIAVLVPAAITLVWLGVRLLQQDRALWAQRDAERQEAAADAIVRSLGQLLAEAERRLAEGQSVEGALFLERSPGRLELRPREMAAWTPSPAPLKEIDSRAFESAERLEFQGAPEAALAEYGRLARSPAIEVRAGALFRTARVHRTLGRRQAAIADYRALAAHTGYGMSGTPVDLLARRRLCALLLEAGDVAGHTREAALLDRDFAAGRWSLSRADWEVTDADLSKWGTRDPASSVTQRAISAAVDLLIAEDPPRAAAGRRIVATAEVPVTLLWRGTPDQRTAMALAPEALRAWIAGAAASYPPDSVALSLNAESGAALAQIGSARQGRSTRRAAADTGLPWTLTLAPGPAWSIGEEFASRRRLLVAGLIALGLLLSAGSYLLWRVVQRELAVARLQAEFVSAVSHEFRTPVTSLRHVIELLEEDDDLPRERRQAFYDVLGRSTERLNRLVESLLDFGRMEEGRKPYDLRPLDAVGFATALAAEFEKNAAPASHRIAVDAVSPQRLVRADEAALGHALWNLLDNAVKYSPHGGAITIRISDHELGAAISVCDSGLGVPPQERREIFTRFVRGAQAHRLGIKGTGVGLAIVSHIMQAHGGRIELESEEGKGSTFTLVLPSAA